MSIQFQTLLLDETLYSKHPKLCSELLFVMVFIIYG